MTWKCFECGACCQSLVLSPKEWKNIKRVVGKKKRHEFEARVRKGFAGTDRLYWPDWCLFMDGGKCSIYNVRPSNCRNFMCGRKSIIEVVRIKNNRCLNHDERMKRDPEYAQFYEANRERVYNEWSINNGW